MRKMVIILITFIFIFNINSVCFADVRNNSDVITIEKNFFISENNIKSEEKNQFIFPFWIFSIIIPGLGQALMGKPEGLKFLLVIPAFILSGFLILMAGGIALASSIPRFGNSGGDISSGMFLLFIILGILGLLTSMAFYIINLQDAEKIYIDLINKRKISFSKENSNLYISLFSF